jgi:hypothetical protein
MTGYNRVHPLLVHSPALVVNTTSHFMRRVIPHTGFPAFLLNRRPRIRSCRYNPAPLVWPSKKTRCRIASKAVRCSATTMARSREIHEPQRPMQKSTETSVDDAIDFRCFSRHSRCRRRTYKNRSAVQRGPKAGLCSAMPFVAASAAWRNATIKPRLRIA